MLFRDRAFLLVTILVLISSLPVYSQTVPDVLERVREIKFFESDREAVKQVLYEMVFDGTYGMRDGFTFGDLDISVHYSTGECDEEEEDVFKSEAGKVVRIEISSSELLLIPDIGLDLSKMTKEQVYHDLESMFIYHDKKLGIAVRVFDDEVEEVLLIPPVSSISPVCDYDFARQFIANESWFGVKLENRISPGTPNLWADVTDLELSSHDLAASTNKLIDVSTTAVDPENDPLTYNYTVTAGKIIGDGRRVVWDLSGVAPGTYEITVGADDGCGICGQTQTKTVTIK